MGQGSTATPTRLGRHRRGQGLRWLGGRRDRSARLRPVGLFDAADLDAASEPSRALRVSVRFDPAGAAVVTLSGLLVRQHADDLDRSLGPVFAGDHPLYVIDLGGVTRLDPTTLATITRCAETVRERGAVVTIVPPGAGRDLAA